MKRLFDVVSALIVLILLLPLFIVISLWIIIDSKGGVFYKQERIGKNQKKFGLYKFRSMQTGADKQGQITIGNDNRITKVGHFIRKYKIDELPQLINIIRGDMSVVGPRPEVKKYVDLYTNEQLKVLSVKPGLTDYASIEYFDEQTILGQAEDPNKEYIEVVMPAKLNLNLKYIKEKSLLTDLKIIFKTLGKIF
ncbi:MAG TPA: sugar transferase [Crocinitomix sp.]|nr:sugar transferase [Crocinitomix sp.]